MDKVESMSGNKLQVKQGLPVTSQDLFNPQEETEQAVDGSMPGQDRTEIGPLRGRCKHVGNLDAQERNKSLQYFGDNFLPWLRDLQRIFQAGER
jgi:hypothetical protein